MIKKTFLNKLFSILVLLFVIIWGILPLFSNQITNEIISTSIIVIGIGLGYISILYKPEWNKGVLFLEGLIISVAGSLFLSFPYNYLFIAIGVIVIIVSILAYRRKLPNFLLGFFYR